MSAFGGIADINRRNPEQKVTRPMLLWTGALIFLDRISASRFWLRSIWASSACR